MIFDSKKLIPEVYGRERDIQVLTRLLDIIFTTDKHYIDDLGCLYEPNRCPEQFLPLLADTLNYKYNFLDTVTVNRKIIDVFTIMEQNRGSEIGLKMASALCLTARDISVDNNEIEDITDYLNALKDLKITYCYEPDDNEYGYTATIFIDYPNTYTLVRYLLDYVRPVGMYVILRSVADFNNTDELVILAQLKAKSIKYRIEQRSSVNSAIVNFSSPIDYSQIGLDKLLVPDNGIEDVISYIDNPDYTEWINKYNNTDGLYETTSDEEETKENWQKFLEAYNSDWIFGDDVTYTQIVKISDWAYIKVRNDTTYYIVDDDYGANRIQTGNRDYVKFNDDSYLCSIL